jgi:hypothetical protein
MPHPVRTQVFSSISSVKTGPLQNLESPTGTRKVCAHGVDSVLVRIRLESLLPRIVSRLQNESKGNEAE